MTCASFGFKHDLSCMYCSELTINTSGLAHNQQSAITVVMHNMSAFQAWGSVVIYWSQVVPNQNSPGCYLLSNVGTGTEIAGPDVGNTLPPKLLGVRGTQSFTFGWTPSGSVAGSIECPNLMALFVQAYVIADANHGSQSFCPGQWFNTDYSIQSVYNAAQVFSYSQG
jgi:hypothetical protein